jgi:hypothetical protein
VPESYFSEDFYDRWEHLISTVEISEVPMRFIREVSIAFDNDEITVFDIQHMINHGYDVKLIEETVEDFLSEHDDIISQVDFHINIPALAEEVDAKTNRLLGDD